MHHILFVISSIHTKGTHMLGRDRKFGKFLRIKQAIALTTTAGLLFTGCATNAGGGAEGDDFPNEDIRLVVPWEAGGSGDLSARTLAPLLEDELGVNVIVENRPGANGSVGYNRSEERRVGKECRCRRARARER